MIISEFPFKGKILTDSVYAHAIEDVDQRGAPGPLVLQIHRFYSLSPMLPEGHPNGYGLHISEDIIPHSAVGL